MLEFKRIHDNGVIDKEIPMDPNAKKTSPCLRELRAERARDSWERGPRERAPLRREAAICAGEGVRFDIVWSQFHRSWRGRGDLGVDGGMVLILGEIEILE